MTVCVDKGLDPSRTCVRGSREDGGGRAAVSRAEVSAALVGWPGLSLRSILTHHRSSTGCGSKPRPENTHA